MFVEAEYVQLPQFQFITNIVHTSKISSSDRLQNKQESTVFCITDVKSGTLCFIVMVKSNVFSE